MARKQKDSGVPHPLLTILRLVDRPGDVCVSRDLPMIMPGLEVEGLGAVGLPLATAQARALIKQCRPAPYGKGTETVVDPDVRRVWELDPARFSLNNPRWWKLIDEIASETRAGLGLEDCALKPQLYRLLVYEKGSFFLPHRDGEKLEGMVATLVIALPSRHAGGELIVSHEGRRREIRFEGAASGHELSYAAFYADCEHEVRPVTSGFRLCLVYNLALAKKRGKKPIAAPRNAAAIAAAADYLAKWPAAVHKLAVALDHQYSKDGLSIATLKGVDRPRAEVLFAAAEQADCVAHLALITRWQSGSAEGGAYDYGYRYGHRSQRRRYGDWSDEEEDDESEGQDALSGYSMGEVYDERLSIDCWLDRSGKRVPLGSMSIDDEQIVAAEDAESWTISREEFEGYTGNAGMTLERWYHRAAVLTWPKRHHFRVLCEAGTDPAIVGLQGMVDEWRTAAGDPRDAQRRLCEQFARAIMDSWSPRLFSWDSTEPIDRSVFPQLLLELDSPRLLRRLLVRVMPRDGDVRLPGRFAALARKHGWTGFSAALRDLMSRSTHGTFARNAGLLETLCLDRSKDPERVELCRELAAEAVSALERLDPQKPRYQYGERPLELGRLLASLVKGAVGAGAAQPLARLVDYTLAADYDLTDVHLQALFAIEAWLARRKTPVALEPAIRRWIVHCREELERRTACAPERPRDFRRPCKITCKCADCQQVKRFMEDPHESVLRMPLAEARRRHLHERIDACRCDLTHVTARKGRPYALVCTKTEASFEAAGKVYQRDGENLTKLRAFEANDASSKRNR